jgi:cation:H+ antiporter
MVLENFLIFLVGSFVLVKSASYAVRSIINIANYFRFSEFFVTFFVAGLISIVPEFLIGINSALAGSPAVGLGTLIGSNVADLTIVIGIVALVGKKINVERRVIKNTKYFFIATSMPILLMLDGVLSRDDGIFLVLIFLFYIYNLFHREKIFSKRKAKGRTLYRNIGVFALSMVLLFVSSHYIVESAVELSNLLMVPSIIIGIFLVAIGTTLPELTFSLRAVLAKHKEIALGDIFGNVAIDSTLSIGVLAIIYPITTNFNVFATSALFMVFAALLISTLLNDNGRITRNESYALFFLYAMFVIIELKSVIG